METKQKYDDSSFSKNQIWRWHLMWMFVLGPFYIIRIWGSDDFDKKIFFFFFAGWQNWNIIKNEIICRLANFCSRITRSF